MASAADDDLRLVGIFPQASILQTVAVMNDDKLE